MSDTVFPVDDSTSKFNKTAQEVNNLGDILKLEFKKYTQNKVLYDLIGECVKDNLLEDPLKRKVSKKLMISTCSQCNDLGNSNNGSEYKLLGVDIPDEELSYSETIQLKNIINNRLKMKYKDISDQFSKIVGKNLKDVMATMHEEPLVELSSEDKVLLEYKQQLSAEQNIYVENLLQQLELLEELMKLRLNTVPEVTQQKTNEYQVRSRMNALRSKLAQEKVRVDIFTETNSSLDAYKIIINDIKDQQKECKKEIDDLLEIKEKYKTVSCKQFDDILKSFLQYKASIEKKRLLYDCLNS